MKTTKVARDKRKRKFKISLKKRNEKIEEWNKKKLVTEDKV